MRPKHDEYENDAEFLKFQEMLQASDRCPGTIKSYKASYKKMRNLLNGKNIRDSAQETCSNVIQVAMEKINTQMSLINICVLVRKLEPEMPIDRLVEQRSINKGVVRDALKQVNTLKELPSLEDYDIYLESLWDKKKYKEYIINYLLRHHYVRNLDLIFDIVSSKSETLDDLCKNYIWLDRRQSRCVYIRNMYKTAKTYGKKTAIITDKRFLSAVKKEFKKMDSFPIEEDPALIGYRINKMTLPDKKGNRLGESNCLKIIVNHYRDNYQKLKEISLSRGTNLEVLLTSYNISYRNDTLN